MTENDENLTLTQLSEEYGLSRNAVRSRLYRRGLNSTREEYQELRDTVSTMKPQDAVAFLLDCIEILTSVEKAPEIYEGMTKLESRIYNRLLISEGNLVTREQLYTAMYFDRHADEYPAVKIMDVKICKLRKKLPANNTIETVWGLGWRLVRG